MDSKPSNFSDPVNIQQQEEREDEMDENPDDDEDQQQFQDNTREVEVVVKEEGMDGTYKKLQQTQEELLDDGGGGEDFDDDNDREDIDNDNYREDIDNDNDREDIDNDNYREDIDGEDGIDDDGDDDDLEELEEDEEVDPFDGITDIDIKLSMMMKTIKTQNEMIQVLMERTQHLGHRSSSSSSSSSFSSNTRHRLLSPNDNNGTHDNFGDSDIESEATILDYTDDVHGTTHRRRRQSTIMRPSYLMHRPRRVCLYEGCGIDIMNRGSRAIYCEQHAATLRAVRAKEHNQKTREARQFKAAARVCAVCSVDISNRGTRALYCELHSVNFSKPGGNTSKPKTRSCAQPGCGVVFTLRHGHYRTLYCDHHRALRAQNKTTTPKSATLVKICAKKGCNNQFEINGFGKGKGSYRTKYCLEHRTGPTHIKREFVGNQYLYDSSVFKRSKISEGNSNVATAGNPNGELEGFMQRRIDNFLSDDDLGATADFLDDGMGAHIPNPHLVHQQSGLLSPESDEIEEIEEEPLDTSNEMEHTNGADVPTTYDPFLPSTIRDNGNNADTDNKGNIASEIETHYDMMPPIHTTAVPSAVIVPS